MKSNWMIKALVFGAILAQGIAGSPPTPMIALDSIAIIPEGAAICVAGERLRIAIEAVGYMWYVDGESDVFAQGTVTYRGSKSTMTLTMGDPLVLGALQIEMLAGDYGHHCTVRVTRVAPFF